MSLRLPAFAVLLLGLSASATLGDEPRFVGRTRQEWATALAMSSQQQLRSEAAWALANMAAEQGGPDNAREWLDTLAALIQSDSPTVRYWGMTGLGRLVQKLDAAHPDRPAAAQALDGSLSDASPSVRIAAAEALALAGQPATALPVLVEAMDSRREAVRIQAVAALEKLGDAAQPAQATLQAATSDSSEYVKRISTRALRRWQP